jgi:aminopeptidase N
MRISPVFERSLKSFLFFVVLFGWSISNVAGQSSPEKKFTRQDTLRGTVTPERAWWNATYYHVEVTPDYDQKSIKGVNTITFKVLKAGDFLQLDLQEPMHIDSALYKGQPIMIQREGNAYFLKFNTAFAIDEMVSIRIVFSGTPRQAIRPPWDGGWIWAKDTKGRPWMSVACQGLGASVWYPCKDHQSDEPDSAALSITVPKDLVGVGNGRLRSVKKNSDETSTYTWAVVNPINNYNLIPYIGHYENWTETYAGEKGNLDCSYWVLDYNVEAAKSQFVQAREMLQCFEHWFGPYPFYEDGYKLVESPHLGMEHQSAVAYGNKFANGYLGRDLSSSGWGLKWDYILVHESGHEWFGNNITSNDIADMWVHEGFTDYSETIFTGWKFGVEAGNDYVVGLRKGIQNKTPLLGPYGVNEEGSGDMYNKGANLLHTIRHVINDDEKFRSILRDLNKTFYHETVTSAQIEKFISDKSGFDLHTVFDQYLRTVQIPVLEYKIVGNKVNYHWTNCVPGFDMPLQVQWHGTHRIKPTEKWKTLKTSNANVEPFVVDRNFYVTTRVAE